MRLVNRSLNLDQVVILNVWIDVKNEHKRISSVLNYEAAHYVYKNDSY